MPLMGSLPQPITSEPAVVAVYVLLILMLAGALAAVLLPRTLFAVAAYCATMVLVAFLYLLLDVPILLFALQLLVFSTVSAALLFGLLRRRDGVDRSSTTSLRADWIVGAGVAAGLLTLLLVVVVAVTTWPVGFCCGFGASLGSTLANDYAIGIAVLVIILVSAAIGAGLLLRASVSPSRPRLQQPVRERGGRGPRDRRA